MFDSKYLQSFLNLLTPSNYFYIAYSGGLDSHVLLHALAALFSEQNKLKQLRAIHIDHGWSKNAKQWSDHCKTVCKKLGIIYEVVAIDAQAKRGESKEAVARDLRYAVFAKYLKEGDYLLTAHQQDDQAETLLLQLLRGAGVKGLACMPEIILFAKGFHLRPLLNFSRDDLRQYALQHNLLWIEDESNFDTQFDRNYMRHQVMPIINQHWPKAQVTITRSAQHLAAADQLLSEMAREDLQKVKGNMVDTLSISKLIALNENCAELKMDSRLRGNGTAGGGNGKSRLNNVLRFWLQQHNFSLPSEIQLKHIINDVIYAKSDRAPKVKWGNVTVTCFRDDLYACTSLEKNKNLEPIVWNLNQPLILPDIGILRAQLVKGKGIRQEVFAENKAIVKFRSTGERCKPIGRIGSHPLKKLLQEWNVPPWQRDRIPLLYNQAEQLISVVNYCVCDPFAAKENEVGWVTFLDRSKT